MDITKTGVFDALRGTGAGAETVGGATETTPPSLALRNDVRFLKGPCSPVLSTTRVAATLALENRRRCLLSGGA
jgi:hypothetical protein